MRPYQGLPVRLLPPATRSIGSNQKRSAGDMAGTGMGDGRAAIGVGLIVGAGIATTGTAIGGVGERFTRLP